MLQGERQRVLETPPHIEEGGCYVEKGARKEKKSKRYPLQEVVTHVSEGKHFEHLQAEHYAEKKPEPLTHIENDNRQSGIAISGGGIRSAAFALGVLQSLSWNRVKQYDYLSTVSGGSWLGCAITARKEDDPLQNIEDELLEHPNHVARPFSFPLCCGYGYLCSIWLWGPLFFIAKFVYLLLTLISPGLLLAMAASMLYRIFDFPFFIMEIVIVGLIAMFCWLLSFGLPLVFDTSRRPADQRKGLFYDMCCFFRGSHRFNRMCNISYEHLMVMCTVFKIVGILFSFAFLLYIDQLGIRVAPNATALVTYAIGFGVVIFSTLSFNIREWVLVTGLVLVYGKIINFRLAVVKEIPFQVIEDWEIDVEDCFLLWNICYTLAIVVEACLPFICMIMDGSSNSYVWRRIINKTFTTNELPNSSIWQRIKQIINPSSKKLSDYKDPFLYPLINTTVSPWQTNRWDDSYAQCSLTPHGAIVWKYDNAIYNFETPDLSLAGAAGGSSAAIADEMGTYSETVKKFKWLLVGAGMVGFSVRTTDEYKRTAKVFDALFHILLLFFLIPSLVLEWFNNDEYSEWAELMIFLWFCCKFVLLAISPFFSFLWSIPWIFNLNLALGIKRFSSELPDRLYLSDGGHTDNFGILPLLYAKKKKILVIDGTAEPSDKAGYELLGVLRYARRTLNVSFSATHIDRIVDVEAKFRYLRESNTAATKFSVHYSDGESGEVVYVKLRTTRDSAKESNIKSAKGCCCNCCGNSLWDNCDCCCYVLGTFPMISTVNQCFHSGTMKLVIDLGKKAGNDALGLLEVA